MAGENYIGSKISLISLSDIRYVGILHSINAQDSTVGLKQVRSFGTEGRRGKPEEEIPASDNVFDYVVFRGSDIKDLQVFEAPPKPTPPPQQPVPQDPAIMSMSGYPPVNPYMNNGMYMQQPQQTPPQQRQQASGPAGAQKYWQPSYNEPEVDKAKLEKDTLDELKAELEETDSLQPTINEAAIEQLAKKVSELNTSDDNIISSKNIEEQHHQQQSRRRYDNNYNHGNNNYRGRGGRYNNNDRQFNGNKTKAEFSIPTSEFDFEASNAKFDKSEIVKKDHEEADDTEEEIEIPAPDEFYDKTSSFFDNISCESKERNEQRQLNEPRRSHFHEERKLNLETFGQATVDQSRYRNNYRGRGNYRGGNRGGNNNNGYYRNNRNNNNYNNGNNNGGYRQNKPQDQQEAN
ncbi:Scd6-like Sm domain-containing protein [Thamnidium elegans]|uniref:Uncharacterized protein n=1 Tax=Thamnidium elegans TaxID=101142 RepID=A0A8H7SVQ1_9FUNG|nr:hypothetical protein INT48_003511 [Thamnidium elegans]KAI8052718.1 Scd6-like Sm domain-containing protein [Thamnidium elegans]